MTMDKSLRTSMGLARARGVLTRGERIAKLQEMDRFADGRSPLGLPKVRVVKLSMKKKKKTKEEGAEGDAAAPAAGAKAAAGAKGAAPAAKAAAPAKGAPAKGAPAKK
jgi:small basic protein (TIGR04137 family)